MRSRTVQYTIPGSAILQMCRPTLSFFPSSSPTSSDGHNSQFHAFFLFSLNGSPRPTTTCLEAMLDVKPHNALCTPFPEAGKCILDSSLRYSCAKTRCRSETDLKYFFGFLFFCGRIFVFLSGNTVGEKWKSAERRNNYRLWLWGPARMCCCRSVTQALHMTMKSHQFLCNSCILNLSFSLLNKEKLCQSWDKSTQCMSRLRAPCR